MDTSRELPSGEVVRNSLRADLEAAEEEYCYLKTQPWDYHVMGTEIEYLSKKYNIYPETLFAYMGLDEDPDKDEWIKKRDGKGWELKVKNPDKLTSQRSKSVQQLEKLALVTACLYIIELCTIPVVVGGFVLILMFLGVV